MSQTDNIQGEQKRRFSQMSEAIGNLISRGQQLIHVQQQQGEVQPWSVDIARKLDDCSRKWNDQCFQVAILALVKSGKSTLINSWLGDEFLPTSNVPETARVVRIQHTPGNSEGLLIDGENNRRGVQGINNYISKLNVSRPV